MYDNTITDIKLSDKTCKRCLHEYSKKIYLLKHLENDTICKVHEHGQDISKQELLKQLEPPVYKYACKHCCKTFKKYDVKYRHEKKNCKANKTIPVTSNVTDEKEEHLHEKPSYVKSLDEKIDRLSSDISLLKNSIVVNSATTITNNIDNGSTNNLNLPYNFGYENIQHIIEDKDFMRGCLQTLRSGGLLNLMSKIHFDNSHPENKNIKLKCTRRRECSVFESGKWETKGITDATYQLLQQGRSLLSQYYLSDIEFKENDETNNKGDTYIHLSKVGVAKEKAFNAPIKKGIRKLLDDNRSENTLKTVGGKHR